MRKPKTKDATLEIPLPPPLPELPAIAKHYLRPEKVESYTYALSDLLCWMDGFKAAGGVYSPGSLDALRDLNCNLKSIQEQQTNNHVI